MSNVAKKFLATYGTVGLGVYSGVTVINMAGIYVGLRMGSDSLLLHPLERMLGHESETVQKIKQQLGEAQSSNEDTEDPMNHSNQINWVREGTYFGIATAVDSLVLPIKLAVCLPIAKAILKRRGR
jgi:hypothetical protein